MEPGVNQTRNKVPELRVLVEWTGFLEWLMLTTEKFPKRMRFTLTNRIDNLALDMVEKLIEAQYTRNRKRPIAEANLMLDKLRILIRISHKLRYVSHQQYEHASRRIDDIGRMLGAWGKAAE